MTRCKVIYLSIVAILLLTSTVIAASADANSTNETNPIPSTYDNNTGIVEREITLNMNFLTSMLQMQYFTNWTRKSSNFITISTI
jgi:hypothetical protein